jgi:hypothetical protein
MNIKSVFLPAGILAVLAILISAANPTAGDGNQNATVNSWETELNEMNYLVLKASSINLIYGLHLNREQAAALKNLAERVAASLPAAPDTKGQCSEDVREIRNTYAELNSLLATGQSLTDGFQKKVFSLREKQADMIKRSLLGAQEAGYKGEDCLQCHCEPQHFPAGDIRGLNTKTITADLRKETDEAHVRGLFGDEATLLIWQLKDSVWNILSNGQRFVSKDYRCCLIPSDVIKDPSRIGQAAFEGGWLEYLRSIRELNEKDWNHYKFLFLFPVDELLRASLPGIRDKEVKKRIAGVESVITEARKLSRMEFDIQKETLCGQLAAATSIEALNGEMSRTEENRRFITAMFLLYFGSPELYDSIISQH